MPGMFGGYTGNPKYFAAFKRYFTEVWGAYEAAPYDEAFLGGHAFDPDFALYTTANGWPFAIDGEHAHYQNALNWTQSGDAPLFQTKGDRLEPALSCKGNLAIVDRQNQTLHLVAEWTGSFPLYYTQVKDGLVFSSYLRPLAKMINASPDPVGISEYLKYGHGFAGRTFFKNIHRLLAGQALTYRHVDHQLHVEENSRAWQAWNGPIDFEQLLEETGTTYYAAVQRCLGSSTRNALMASAGWDTRLLLSAFVALPEKSDLLCYAHGDPECRELALTRQMVEDLRIKYLVQPIDGSMYELHELQRGFSRTEVVNPLWHRAGLRLAAEGMACVSAGVIGEVIGGRHGRHWPFLPISEWDKMKRVTSQFMRYHRNPTRKSDHDLTIFYNMLHLERLRKPWYVRSEFWNALPNLTEEIQADNEEFVRRLKRRGVENTEKLCEAFTAEYHGVQMLMQQLLCCRSHLNVCIPFGDQALWHLTSRIPLSFKIVHSLQQALLRKYAPYLLSYPNAASLINSKLPIPVLEVLRVTRKVRETIKWQISRLSHGRYKPQSIAWSNFAALADSPALQNMADDLRGDLFDKSAIQNGVRFKIAQTKTEPTVDSLNALQAQLSGLYTVDLMFR